ncbi:hypothetical protein MTX78_07560 [Hymenobacter tibetensis]|uniref:Secreted protein n=1 Tax=Hymenobacter tibetensis TaxID=497967 RepID=A0ABY4D285_9BACT|nr:hypothetical protein [Hymenobacter tibetensis]UOG76447.1 hypothetical protein MTX78_07560 [Hymenobacter tibetensis]
MAHSSLGFGPSVLCVLVFAAVGYLRPDHALSRLDKQGLYPAQATAFIQPTSTTPPWAKVRRGRLCDWLRYAAEARPASAATASPTAPRKLCPLRTAQIKNHSNHLRNRGY